MICGHDDTQRATLTEKRGPTFMTDGRKRASGLEAADIGSGLRPKNIGARVKRVEDPRLLTGQGAFTADRLVPGAMHVAFRRSDHAHAIISSINTSAAAEMPGVFAIYTAQELDDLVKPVRASSRMENYHATTLYPLAREKVRYVGEPVVVVLAENRYLAEDARDRIEIAYEALAIVIDPEIAVRADAPLLHVEAGTNVLAMREFARGDIGAEMTAAPMRVGGRFRFHRKTPIAIENRACLAEYDRGRRSLTLTLSTQIPGIIRDLLADLLDMPGHSVRVVAADVGGGFGGKASLYQEETGWRILPRRVTASTKSSTQNSGSTETAASSRLQLRSLAMSGHIRSIRGQPPSSRSRSSASCRALTAYRPIAGMYARSQRAKCRPGLIAA
jgi:carbon-monoxide dehydrogenase large subunit